MAGDLRHTREAHKLRTKRWIGIGAALLFSSVLGWGLYRYLGGPPHGAEPLLKGPPVFIVLALAIALAGYLRQVSTSAAELRDKIKRGGAWNYPVDAEYRFTDEKVRLLEKTWQNLSIAASFIITLFVVVSVRIAADAFLRFRVASSEYPKWVFVWDALVALWLVVIVGTLAVMHSRARWRDEGIRAKSREKEDEILAKWREKQTKMRTGTEDLLEGLSKIQAKEQEEPPEEEGCQEQRTQRQAKPEASQERHVESGVMAIGVVLGIVFLILAIARGRSNK